MLKEYTISKVNMLSEGSISAVLIDEHQKEIPVTLMRTIQDTWFANTTENTGYMLLSASGEELKTIKEFDSVFLNVAIPSDWIVG